MLDSYGYLIEVSQNGESSRRKQKRFIKENWHWFKVLAIILIALGVFFRLVNIEGKVYWHDEVYTSARASGYLFEEIYQSIVNHQIISVADLQKFQNIKPQSTALDTINSLVKEDPQHPPFYFLITRLILIKTGITVLYSRILPILISIFSLVLMYFFVFDIFSSKLIATLATILLSLSPFDVIFSQINRQYSLLTLLIILSSWLFWRSHHSSNWKNYSLYVIASTIGLYTHPFFILTLLSHDCFILVDQFWLKSNKTNLKNFILSGLTIIILYLPWLLVLINNREKVERATSWAYHYKSPLFLLKLWNISYSNIFTDINFEFDNIGQYLYHFFFIIIIFLSFSTLYLKVDRSKFYFVLFLALIPFLCLAIPDLIQGSYRSAITRYAMICFLGMQIAVAFFLANKITHSQKWRVLFVILLTNSIISCAFIAFSDNNLAKIPSEFNGEIARKINTFEQPIVISDRGDGWTNIANIISLSYLVKKDTRFFLTTVPPDQQRLENVLQTTSSELLAFRPSTPLKSSLESMSYKLENISVGDLYRITQK